MEYESWDTIDSNNGYYPEQLKLYLGVNRPKILFSLGKASILKQRLIMVCGARNVSEMGFEIAYKCGRCIVENGYAVASGYARGVDRGAHFGALEAGGETVAMVPYGLSRFRVHSGLATVFDPERVVAISEAPPDCGFTVNFAFRRNKILAALAEAVIVIEPGEGGGSWYSAERARRMGRPLYFFEGARLDVIDRMGRLDGKRLEVKHSEPDLTPVFEQCQI
ncbi:MAG: DNA-processing protein DprA [Candidatus Latescibacteria bacterium]|nr:DNA-processing protein DprA [Candidatus Latescibacterota bacterium]